MPLPVKLEPDSLLGGLSREEDDSPVIDTVWYRADAVGDGLEYRFPAGLLRGAQYLTADMLLDGEEAGVFTLELQEGADGPIFQLGYGLLPGASARMRIPLAAVTQNRGQYEREGTWVKPHVGGQRVDLKRVDRMRITVSMQAEAATRWCMTPVIVTAAAPLKLAQPTLPEGPLLDEFGQSTRRRWPGRSRSADEVNKRLLAQLRDAPAQRWPDGFSKWGGWSAHQFDTTGYFHTHWDAAAERWWLVDPEGYAFWSAGQAGVRPSVEADVTGLENALTWLPDVTDVEYTLAVRQQDERLFVDYLQANLVRAFGPNAWPTNWMEIALAQLRRAGFNTLGSGSDWQIASDAGFPYVRALTPPPGCCSTP